MGIRGGIEQDICSSGGNCIFPTPTTWSPTFYVTSGSITVAPTIIKASYIDWTYKLEFTISFADMEVNGNPVHIGINLPGGFSPISLGSASAKEVFAPGSFSYVTMAVVTGPNSLLFFNQSGSPPWDNNVPIDIICTGSVWLV